MSLQATHLPYNHYFVPSLELAAKQFDPTSLTIFGAGLFIGALAINHFQRQPKDVNSLSNRHITTVPVQFEFHICFPKFQTTQVSAREYFFFDLFYPGWIHEGSFLF